MHIFRLFVTPRTTTSQESEQLRRTFEQDLQIPLTDLRVYERYDISGITESEFERAKTLIFSEPPIETTCTTLNLSSLGHPIAIAPILGQYDQRADAAEQCLSILTGHDHSTVRTARIYVLRGPLTKTHIDTARQYLLQSIDAYESSMDLPTTLDIVTPVVPETSHIKEFTTLTKIKLEELLHSMQLAMTLEDLLCIQRYFQTEHRNPTVTEIRVLDTYWSDHCRHTTFNTQLTEITFDESALTKPIRKTYQTYLETKQQLNPSADVAPTLMDMATMAMQELRHQGKLNQLDVSDEINACTIIVPVQVDGKKEEWLLLFKNETHNHPTEIEPFGGAATCLGGCIRDPLSGRAYVYQAMRITGSGNPLVSKEHTLLGKLPQSYITTTAAKGFSSYGNQIGVPTGEVREYYHDSYRAKRLEVGAVIGAVPRSHVHRENPIPGDLIILLGGKTGRDGCGGATGSSKIHTKDSLSICGAEVQKGNPVTERKIQRLFRNPEVTQCIKRCNDFGAGGVAVAIGELADSIHIYLDAIPTKYTGLTGTELAISESQERMACIIDPSQWKRIHSYCAEENLEATIVGEVTNTGRLVMDFQGEIIVNLHRQFLATNGATQSTTAHIVSPRANHSPSFITNLSSLYTTTKASIETRFHQALQDLNSTSQEGLRAMFDSTVGANTVLFPFSGTYLKTPVQGMVAKLPVLQGTTTTASIMTHGFDPYLSEWSPYHGAQYAILLSLAKLAAIGGDISKAYLSFQEYFEKLNTPMSWGKVISALLGAYEAQRQLGVAAIGGKDSMSGTFQDLHVPPSLISFAVTTEDIHRILSPHFHEAHHHILFLYVPELSDGTPNWAAFKAHCKTLRSFNITQQVYSAYVVEQDGIGPATVKACLGNAIGCVYHKDELQRLVMAVSSTHKKRELDQTSITQSCANTSENDSLLASLTPEDILFYPFRGSFLIEVDTVTAQALRDLPHMYHIGTTQEDPSIVMGDTSISLDDLTNSYESSLASIFPIYAKEKNFGDTSTSANSKLLHTTQSKPCSKYTSLSHPKVLIPVFPGTNCEYESARAFTEHGAKIETLVIRNRSSQELQESIQALKRSINSAQIVCFPGGFSSGDEPAGSGKFIATLFHNPYLQESLENLLYKRDGLVLGICNGFQALIKLGLVPTGHIQPLEQTSPTLTYNTIGRHISTIVHTKVVSTNSPWLSACQIGDIYTVPISHGEGRFLATTEQVEELYAQGQVATQYVDFVGNTTYDPRWNPNQSIGAVEGLLSPDGRILGKMAHIERLGHGIHKNINGNLVMPIFASGVHYFID
ncbi:phosphoribosylformylglycinamidine synthase [Veillonella sp. DNF00869]|uniref:phosphoribosylformylglycinamidine synthase n=1 Tax=Veillonella sp. DNF00869 TaxID=1384081 RepID=UPI00078438B2|nr:phosphoribosylformylglycinamidine synthase [Veillonella sp. DNF00869]KXB86631.1 phosphoribosylformylglycinamidine synthase [Veillonella sp. DNF00869]